METDWAAEDKCPEKIWEDMKKVYLKSTEQVLGKKESKKSKPYVSEEILQFGFVDIWNHCIILAHLQQTPIEFE